jgi:hypothetical protein
MVCNLMRFRGIRVSTQQQQVGLSQRKPLILDSGLQLDSTTTTVKVLLQQLNDATKKNFFSLLA